MRGAWPRLTSAARCGDIQDLDAVPMVVYVIDGYIVEAWDNSMDFRTRNGRLTYWRAEVEE